VSVIGIPYTTRVERLERRRVLYLSNASERLQRPPASQERPIAHREGFPTAGWRQWLGQGGPKQASFDKSWQLEDIVAVN